MSLLNVDNVSKRFGNLIAVNEVSMMVEPGWSRIVWKFVASATATTLPSRFVRTVDRSITGESVNVSATNSPKAYLWASLGLAPPVLL